MKSILETELEMGSPLPETVIPNPQQGSSYAWTANTGNVTAAGISGSSVAAQRGRRFFSCKLFDLKNTDAAALANSSLTELIDFRIQVLR
jgi:hypothetical protein